MKKVAVVSDAVGFDLHFPLWYKYYSEAVGSDQLHLITYANSDPVPEGLKLGGLIHVSHKYEDALRAKFISSFCETLLHTNDIVLRVDIDEILVPDPRNFSDLKDYLSKLDKPYVTALGLDIVQHVGEHTLDINQPILLHQRKFCFPNSSLNKTCLTSHPIRWLSGFHACDAYPLFNQLFLFHLKRADIAQQLRWATKMRCASAGNQFLEKYYNSDLEEVERFNKDIFLRRRIDGWEGIPRSEYEIKLRERLKVELYDGNIVYSAGHFHDEILVSLPTEFLNCF